MIQYWINDLVQRSNTSRWFFNFFFVINIAGDSWAKFPIGNYILPVLLSSFWNAWEGQAQMFLFLVFKHPYLSLQLNRLLDIKALLLLMMWPSYLMYYSNDLKVRAVSHRRPLLTKHLSYAFKKHWPYPLAVA